MTMLKKKMLTDKTGSLHDEYIEAAAQRLADDIDAEVMRGMLVGCGWHEVVIPWIMTHEVSQEVDDWVKNNTKDGFWNRGLVWLFKDGTDAMWFKMRWMS